MRVHTLSDVSNLLKKPGTYADPLVAAPSLVIKLHTYHYHCATYVCVYIIYLFVFYGLHAGNTKRN